MSRIERRDTSEAEKRDRLAPQRSQQKVESDKEREAAGAATAATATKDEEERRGGEQQRKSRSRSRHVRIARLFGEEAAPAMRRAETDAVSSRRGVGDPVRRGPSVPSRLDDRERQ